MLYYSQVSKIIDNVALSPNQYNSAIYKHWNFWNFQNFWIFLSFILIYVR